MRPDHNHKDINSMGGFSLIEVLVVLLIILTGVAVSQPYVSEALRGYEADRAMHTVMEQLMKARQYALDNRRQFQVTVDSSAASITITRMATSSESASVQSVVYLPSYISMSCNGGTTVCSPEGLSTSVSIPIFRPEGTTVDSSGNILNGVVFVRRNDSSATQFNRAVLLYGATSRIKGLRYTGVSWMQ